MSWKLRLYNFIAPWFYKLENELREERTKVLQVEQYKLADEIHDKYRQSETRKKLVEEIVKHRQDIEQCQLNCDHIKGGSRRLAYKDYAVYFHTFIDGSQMVKCQLCGKRWSSDSTDWDNAIKMAEQSSNRQSSSEVSLNVYSDGQVMPISEAIKKGLPLTIK